MGCVPSFEKELTILKTSTFSFISFSTIVYINNSSAQNEIAKKKKKKIHTITASFILDRHCHKP